MGIKEFTKNKKGNINILIINSKFIFFTIKLICNNCIFIIIIIIWYMSFFEY